MQQPFVLAAHSDAAMTERVAGQWNHQDIRLAVAERPHAPKTEPVLAALVVEFPIRPVLPLLGNVAAFWRRSYARPPSHAPCDERAPAPWENPECRRHDRGRDGSAAGAAHRPANNLMI